MSVGRRRRAAHRCELGQTTVELALVLPFLLLLLLTVVQVGMVVRDTVLVGHAAREAARVASVDPDPAAPARAARASASLDPERLDVVVQARGAPGGSVTVVVRYRSPVIVPILRGRLPDVALEARATMRVER